MAHLPHTIKDPNLWDLPWKWRRSRDDVAEEVAPITSAMRYLSHSYMKQTRSGRPEVVVKIVSGAMGKGSVKNIVDYIARDAEYMRGEGAELVTLETQDGEILTTEEERDQLIADWATDFESPERYRKQAWKRDVIQQLEYERRQLGYQEARNGLNRKETERLEELSLVLKTLKYKQGGKVIDLNINAPKDTIHMMLSIGGQGHNIKNAQQAVRNYLNDTFATQGYEFLIAQHTDTDNLHYHVILKAKSRLTGERLQFDKEDLFNLRQEFSYQLAKLGIERTATLRKDRLITPESLSKQRGSLEKNMSWYESKVANAQAVDAFGAKANALKQTERLIGMTKEALAKASSEQAKALKAEMGLLEAHKAKLLSLSPAQLEKEREATVKQLKDEHAKIIAKQPLKPMGVTAGYQRRMEQNRRVWMQRHQRRIDEAISYLKRSQRMLNAEGQKTNRMTIDMLEQLRGGLKRKLKL